MRASMEITNIKSASSFVWNMLLYSALGCFSLFFLVHYADIAPLTGSRMKRQPSQIEDLLPVFPLTAPSGLVFH